MTMRLDQRLMGERDTLQNYRGGKGTVRYPPGAASRRCS